MTKGLKRLQTALFFVAVLAIFAVLFTLVIGGGEGLYNSPVPVAEAAATEGVILQHGSDIGREQEGNVTEVNSLAALRSAVRANTANISITADFSWSYSSNASDFFDGSTFTHKIYGNGHTLTITGKSNDGATFDEANDKKRDGTSWGAVAGVLGNGGAVYDLNVVMSGQICYSSSGAANINIGGIVGQVQSGARVENCTFALKGSASRLASVHYSSGSGIWATAGGIAGEVSGTIANCTVNNEGWIESGLGVFSGNSMQIASDTGYGASGVVAGIVKIGADFQNIVAKGGGNVKTTYYASVLGMLFNLNMSMTVTNFWNAFSGTFHCANNGNSDNFACYLDNRGSNRVAITNYYYSDGYTAVTSDANIATSSKLLVPSGFEGQVYFDPTATDYANSLAVAYTGQREPDPGMTGTWTLIAPNQSPYSTNVLGDGGTVTFTGLPSAVDTWRNGDSGFSAELRYTQQSMESMEALAPYEHGYVASKTQNGTALSTATDFANVFAPNGSGNRSGSYYLTGDLYVNGFTGAEFSGTLDGNGHTLYITGLHQPTYTGPNVGGIVGKLTGTIKNLRVVLLSSQTITITNVDDVNSRSLGLVAGAVTGNGKVENVSAVIPSGVTLEPDGSHAVTTALGAVAGTVGTVEANKPNSNINDDTIQDNVNINNVTVQLDGALHVRGSWIYVAGVVGRGAQAQSTQYHFNNVILRGDGSLGGVTGGSNNDSSEPTYAAALIVLLKPSDNGTEQASVDGFIYDLTTDHSNGNGMPVTGTVSSFGYIAKNNHDTSMSANTPGTTTGYVTCTNIYRTEDSVYTTFHQTGFSKGNTYIAVDATAYIASSVTGHENISLTPYFVTKGEDFSYITLAAKAEGGWGNVSMLRSEGTSAGECYTYDDDTTMKFVKVKKAEAVNVNEKRIGVAEVAFATLQYNTQPSYNHGKPVDFGISVTRGGTPLKLGVDYSVHYTGTDNGYNSDTAPSQTGDYTVTVTLKDGVFEGGQNAKTFEVTVQRLTLTGVGFTVEDWTYGEEGNEPVFTVTGLDDASALFKVTYSGRNGTSYSSDTLPVNAGDYTATATLTDEALTNYLLDGGRITAEFSIAKASISPTVTITAVDWQYRWDGVKATTEVLGNTGNGDVTYTYVGRGDTVYVESSDMPVNAGTYTVIARIDETANYAAGEATADFEIIPRTVTFTVTDDPDAYKFVYGTDGSADLFDIITPSPDSVEEVTTLWDITYTFKVITADGEEDYSAMTHAGSTVRITAVITATVWVGDEETGYSEPDPNIIIEFKDGVDYVERTVAKREVTLTAKGDVKETYGSTREGGFEGEFELSGALPGDNVASLFKITVSGADGAVLPNAGVYTVTAALNETGKENYALAEVSDADLTYTVDPFAISGDWEEAASAEYDGDVHVRKFVPDGDPLPEGVLAYAYSVGEESVAEMKNAAEYTVTVSVTNGNYVFAEGVTTQSSFVIGKKTLTVALESVSGVYTGEAHVLDASSVTYQGNVEGEVPTFTVTVSPDSVVDVAEYAVTVALGEDAVNANYTIQNGDLTYSVTKAGNEWLSEFAVEGNVFGSAAQITLPTAKFGSVQIAYYTDADHLAPYEGGFTQTSPVDIYYYVVTVEGTDNYDGLETEGSFEIAKAEVTVTGITASDGTYDGAAYDGNIEITYSEFAEEISAVEWQFRLADAEVDVWTPGLPTAAGEYVISVAGYTAANVTVTNTADFTSTLSIAKASIEVTASMGDITAVYGTAVTEEEIRAALNVTAAEEAFGDDELGLGFTLSFSVPDGVYGAATPAGTAVTVTVNVTFSDSNYIPVQPDEDLTFVVGKLALTGNLDKQSAVYGGAAQTVAFTPSNKVGEDELTFEYAYEMLTDGEYAGVGNMTAAGSYRVTVTLAAGGASENYTLEEQFAFEITPLHITAVIESAEAAEGVISLESTAAIRFESSGNTLTVYLGDEVAATLTVRFYYAEGEEFSPEGVAFSVGDYTSTGIGIGMNVPSTPVSVSVADANCVLDEVTSTVNIKVTGSITVPEVPPVVTFDPDKSYTKDEIAAHFESELDLTVTVYGYADGAPTEETFESVHNAGVYYVEAVAGEASAHFLFTVNKAENALVTEFAREGWTYGEEPAAVTEPVAADGSAAVAYYTAYTSASDNTPYVGEFDALTPVGTYYAVVTVAESENYLAFEKVYTFAVAKAQNSWTGEFAAGWTYGESPVITLPTAAFGEVEVQYYISYGGDTDVPFEGEFSATTDAGTYYAVITVEGTDNYDGLNAVKEFTVQKASLNASVSISGWVYGEKPSEPVVEGNVGGGEVTFTYSVQSTQGNTGTLVDGRPASVGDYNVSAHIAESTNYKASSVYYDFSVTAREVVIVTGGTEGLVFKGSAFTVTASADELLEEDDVSIVYTLADGKQSILAADTYTLNFELTGEDAFNYVIAEGTESTQVTVAKAEVTVTGITAPDGTYDGAAYDGNIEITYSAFAEEISAVEWQFRLADAEDDVWAPGLPTAAGEYVISVAGYTAANVTVTNTADFTATLSIAKAVVTYNATLASDAKVFFGETLTAEEMKALITPDQALAEAGFTVELLLADGSAFNAETPVGTTLKVVITPVISESDNYVVTVTDNLTLIVQAVEVDIVLDIEDTPVADGDTVTIARGESLPVDAAVAAYMQAAGIPEGSYKILVRGSEFTDTMYWAPGTYEVTVKLMNGYNGAMTFSIVVEEGEPPVDPDLPGPDEPDDPDEPDEPDVPGTDDPDDPTVEQPGEPDEGGFPGWAIAVIVCGGLAVVAIITSIAVVAARKRKASGKKDAA